MIHLTKHTARRHKRAVYSRHSLQNEINSEYACAQT